MVAVKQETTKVEPADVPQAVLDPVPPPPPTSSNPPAPPLRAIVPDVEFYDQNGEIIDLKITTPPAVIYSRYVMPKTPTDVVPQPAAAVSEEPLVPVPPPSIPSFPSLGDPTNGVDSSSNPGVPILIPSYNPVKMEARSEENLIDARPVAASSLLDVKQPIQSPDISTSSAFNANANKNKGFKKPKRPAAVSSTGPTVFKKSQLGVPVTKRELDDILSNASAGGGTRTPDRCTPQPQPIPEGKNNGIRAKSKHVVNGRTVFSKRQLGEPVTKWEVDDILSAASQSSHLVPDDIPRAQVSADSQPVSIPPPFHSRSNDVVLRPLSYSDDVISNPLSDDVIRSRPVRKAKLVAHQALSDCIKKRRRPSSAVSSNSMKNPIQPRKQAVPKKTKESTGRSSRSAAEKTVNEEVGMGRRVTRSQSRQTNKSSLSVVSPPSSTSNGYGIDKPRKTTARSQKKAKAGKPCQPSTPSPTTIPTDLPKTGPKSTPKRAKAAPSTPSSYDLIVKQPKAPGRKRAKPSLPPPPPSTRPRRSRSAPKRYQDGDH